MKKKTPCRWPLIKDCEQTDVSTIMPVSVFSAQQATSVFDIIVDVALTLVRRNTMDPGTIKTLHKHERTPKSPFEARITLLVILHLYESCFVLYIDFVFRHGGRPVHRGFHPHAQTVVTYLLPTYLPTAH